MTFQWIRRTIICGIVCATLLAGYVSWDLIRQAKAIFATSAASATSEKNSGLFASPDALPPADPFCLSHQTVEDAVVASDPWADSRDSGEAQATNYDPTPEYGDGNSANHDVPPPTLAELPPPLDLVEVPSQPSLGDTSTPTLLAELPDLPVPELPPAIADSPSQPKTGTPVIEEQTIRKAPANPIECAIVDRDSGVIVASFRISEASPTVPSKQEQDRQSTIQAANPDQQARGPYAPYLNLRIDLHTGHTLIDARNLPLGDLVAEMNRRYQFPIECPIEIAESVSARIEARDPVTALRRIVEPTGYAVLSQPNRTWKVVRAVDSSRVRVVDSSRYPVARVSADLDAERAAPSSAIVLAGHAVQKPRHAPLPPPTEACNPEQAEIITRCSQLVASGRSDLAMDALAELMSISPNCAPAARLLAECYVARDDMESALTAATEAIRLNRNSFEANMIMGRILQELGQDERSSHYFDQAEYLRELSAVR